VIPVGEAGVANLPMKTKFVNFHRLTAVRKCTSLAIPGRMPIILSCSS